MNGQQILRKISTKTALNPTIFLTLLISTSTSALAKEIECTPSEVRPGDQLTIKMRQALPDIAVITPRKINGVNFFFLNEIGSNLIQSNQLIRQRQLKIDVSNAKLDSTTPLFSTAGTYKFIVSKNLETDDGTPSYTCNVKFTPTRASGPTEKNPKSTNNPVRPTVTPPASTTASPVPAPTPAGSGTSSIRPSTSMPTIDQQLDEQVAAQCPKGIPGLLCKEKLRFSLCSGKWSGNPPPGETACKSSQ